MTGKRCPLPTVLLKIYFKIYFKLKIEVSLYTLRLYVCVFVYGEPTGQRRHASATPRREPPVNRERAAALKCPRAGLFAQPPVRRVGALNGRSALLPECFRSPSRVSFLSARAVGV